MLLKHTQKIIIKKAIPNSLPKEKVPLQHLTSDGDPHKYSQGIGALNCCLKNLHPGVVGMLDPLHSYVSANQLKVS